MRGGVRQGISGSGARGAWTTRPASSREFLTSRRAKVTPEQAGLPTYGPRRVQGLRREEVASLAGVSVEYYKRLERGNASGVSDGVLDALAGALRLDDAERAHLFDLARAANPTPRRGAAARPSSACGRRCSGSSDGMPPRPSCATAALDYLSANALGRALYAPVFESPEQPANSARFTFLDPAAQDFYAEWEKTAHDLVAVPALGGRAQPVRQGALGPRRRAVHAQPAVPQRWAAHNVRFHQTGTKRLHHPVVGELELSYEVLELPADAGLRLAVFSAEPGSRSQRRSTSWPAGSRRPRAGQ